MIQRCPKCIGKKVVMGLGCMTKECPQCDGVGHIKIVLDHDEHKEVDNIVAIESNKPKRGRPKKV